MCSSFYGFVRQIWIARPYNYMRLIAISAFKCKRLHPEGNAAYWQKASGGSDLSCKRIIQNFLHQLLHRKMKRKARV